MILRRLRFSTVPYQFPTPPIPNNNNNNNGNNVGNNVSYSRSRYPPAPSNNSPYPEDVEPEEKRLPLKVNSFPEAMMPFPEESHQSYELDQFRDASADPFDENTSAVLGEPVRAEDCEIKPDGSVYLPEIKYRRILLKAFGVGGWALIPRGPHSLQGNVLSREYALMARGRFVSQARGHAVMTGAFQSTGSVSEAVRSNALMRCCKDLGVAADLWDGAFVAQWKAQWGQRRIDRGRTVWYKATSQS